MVLGFWNRSAHLELAWAAFWKLKLQPDTLSFFVDDNAENQIVLASGANLAFEREQTSDALAMADPEHDWVLCQNETNLVHEIVNKAKKLGLRVAYSAAPFDADHVLPILKKIDLLAVNDGEATALANALGKDPRGLGLPYLLITRGSEGAELWTPDGCIVQPSFKVTPVDTTGAGDTFLGAFLANLTSTNEPEMALEFAAAAAAIQVTRAGAAIAIPERSEITAFLEEHRE